MAVNKRPLSMRDGTISIDGVEVGNASAYSVNFTPDVWSGRTLKEKGTNRRWIGFDITGSLNTWKMNNRYKEMAKNYKDSGVTPEFTITGTVDDTNSDYYDLIGDRDKLTLTGVVFTGDLPLIQLDVTSDVAAENVSFGAKDFN
ncbi:MAG: phage tail tube protein [Lachnospiraceae bacterium]|nr:phage tail tube protein [Lachnospiraceae bacterium]